jgi:hypothetical protein
MNLRSTPNVVVARHDIPDCPSSRQNDSAKKGDRGLVEDCFDGYLAVSFAGRGAILVTPDEVRAVP